MPKQQGAITAAAVGVGVAGVAAAVLFGGVLPRLAPDEAPAAQPVAASTGEPAPTAQPTPDQAQQDARRANLLRLAHRQANDPRAQGKPDAKVVLIEWSDFRCPFCAKWAQETEPALQKYVDDGTLRIEFRDTVVFGQESALAAQAGWAAAEQGKFWEFYRTVYKHAPKEGHPTLAKGTLLAYAKEAGVPDIAKFTKDMTGQKAVQGAQQETQEAQQLGVTSVPMFLVGGTPVQGAQPTATFTQLIEQEAQRAGNTATTPQATPTS